MHTIKNEHTMRKNYYSPSVELIYLAERPIMAAVSGIEEDNDAEAKPNPWSDEDEDEEASNSWGITDNSVFED